MGIDFMPENALEQAIYDRDIEGVVYAVAENNFLTKLAPASNLGAACFSDEVIFTIMFNSMSSKQLEMMTNGWFYGYLRAGERLRQLAEAALEPLPENPSDGEKLLLKAIVFRDDAEVIRLIKEVKVVLRGFAPQLLVILPELSKEAVLTFLRDGLSAKLKAVVLGILLKETQKPDALKELSYAGLTGLCNLMIRIIAGKPVSPNEPWYPEDAGEKIS